MNATVTRCTFLMILLSSTSQLLRADESSVDAIPIALAMTTHASTTLLGEPIVVEVRIRNISDVAQSINPRVEMEMENLLFYVDRPAGSRFRIVPMIQYSVSGGIPQSLGPGELLVHRQMLVFCAQRGALFTEAGCHRIETVWNWRDPEGKGHELIAGATVSVVEPKGVDAEAWTNHFRGNPQAAFAAGFSVDWSIDQEFERLTQRYPTSKYVPWSLYFRAVRWGALRDVPVATGAEKAIGLYRRVLANWPDFPLSVEVRYAIAAQRLRLGQAREATAEMHDLIAEYPDRRLFQRLAKHIRIAEETGEPLSLDRLPD